MDIEFLLNGLATLDVEAIGDAPEARLARIVEQMKTWLEALGLKQPVLLHRVNFK